jgi:hypothetical protein
MAKKEAGAGRGFVNPRRTDESDADYISPAQRYEMEQQVKEAKESAATDAAYNKATGKKKGGMIKKMASGGSASARADGIAQRGKTRGMMC